MTPCHSVMAVQSPRSGFQLQPFEAILMAALQKCPVIHLPREESMNRT